MARMSETMDTPTPTPPGASFSDATVPLPDSDTSTAAPLTFMPALQPKEIGPYRILRLLGEGGMGAVYLAEQEEPVARQVALKIIHTSLLTPAHLNRFHAERNALARLSHPNVAVLHEAGTTADGFPFFAMEHVPQGENLHAYCDRQRLNIEERLELFIQTCRGVQHAHQKGILHRDLKPSNILVAEVDGQRTAKVIDFGLAKSLDEIPLSDRTQLTGGALVGTPAYMSPEILEGDSDLDTRTDVYSLGIMLYELLVERRPSHPFSALLNGQTWSQSTTDTPRPSRRALEVNASGLKARRCSAVELQRRLAGDLDWIVLKALEPDRDDRYASVSELAADLERHLRYEPVSVRPPTLGYQIRKFSRRHRTAVSFASGLLLLLLVAGVALWQSQRQADRRAMLAAVLNRDVERIEWLQRVAHQLPMDRRQDEDPAIRATMQRIAEAHGPDGDGLASYALGRGQLALGDIEAARRHFEAALAAGYDAPEVRLALGWSLSRLYDRQLDIVRRYPDTDLRQAARERADLELRQPALELLQQSPSSDWISPELLEATLALQQGEMERAVEVGRQAADRLIWLYEARFVVGRALLRQAEDAWEMFDRLDEAEALYQAAADEIELGLRIGRSDPEGHRLKCNALGRYTNFLVRFSRPGFDAVLERTLKACRLAERSAPEHLDPRLAQATAWHGKAQIQLWDLGEDPRKALRQMTALLPARHSPDSRPANGAAQEEVQRLLGRAAHTEATYLYRIGESPLEAFERAESHLRQAVHLGPAAADSWSRLASVLAQRAAWLELRGEDPRQDLLGAIQAARRATELQSTMFSAHYSLGQALCAQASDFLKRGLPSGDSLAEAELAFRQAAELEPSSLIVSGALAQVRIQEAALRRQRGEDSAAPLQQGITLLDDAIEQASDATYFRFQKAQSLLGLAWNALDQGQDPSLHTAAARDMFLQGIESLPRVAGPWMELAEAPFIDGRWALTQGHSISAFAEESERYAQRGLELDASRSDGHLMIARAYLLRASTAPTKATPHWEAARQSLQQAIDLAPQTGTHYVVMARLAWMATASTPFDALDASQQELWSIGLESADQALRLNPMDVEAQLLKGALMTLHPVQQDAGEALMALAKEQHPRLVLDWY